MSDTPLQLSDTAFRRLALALCLLPLCAISVAMSLNIWQGSVAVSLPFIDGSISISRACRQLPGLYVFRLLMMPAAVLMAIFWLALRARLSARGAAPPFAQAMWLSGLTGAAFLLLYANFLGTEGEIYAWLRRFGITLHFAGTLLVQLLCLQVLRTAQLQRPSGLWWLSVAIWLLALGHVLLTLFAGASDARENLLEWWLALLMASWFAAMPVSFRDKPKENVAAIQANG